MFSSAHGDGNEWAFIYSMFLRTGGRKSYNGGECEACIKKRTVLGRCLYPYLLSSRVNRVR